MKRLAVLFCLFLITGGCGLGPDMSRDRVPADPSPTPFIPDKSSVEYIRLGDAAFAGGDHAGASLNYKRAFEIERDEKKLDKKQFYALISNLSISYARAGDTKNARVTAAYGLSKKYDHALFHMHSHLPTRSMVMRSMLSIISPMRSNSKTNPGREKRFPTRFRTIHSPVYPTALRSRARLLG